MELKKRLEIIIFGTETKAGKLFDLILLWLIVISVLVVMVESIPSIGKPNSKLFISIEWVLTSLFSLEYLLRIYSSPKPLKYIFSFWGIIDFLSVIPTFLGLILTGNFYFQIVRILRLLRVFRILKLFRFTKEAQFLFNALKASRYKISIFLSTVLALVILLGTIMYVVEGGDNGFASIPQSIYWAIVTITTVGFGDIVPQTVVGKLISSFIMIIGYAIIAVPTGIVTVELSRSENLNQLNCPNCQKMNPKDANYCNNCGKEIK